MTLGAQVKVITDERRTAPSRTNMLQTPMANQEWLWMDGYEFQIHEICNQPFFVRWNVDILMGTVHKSQNRMLGSSYNDKEIWYIVFRTVEVIVTALWEG